MQNVFVLNVYYNRGHYFRGVFTISAGFLTTSKIGGSFYIYHKHIHYSYGLKS